MDHEIESTTSCLLGLKNRRSAWHSLKLLETKSPSVDGQALD